MKKVSDFMKSQSIEFEEEGLKQCMFLGRKRERESELSEKEKVSEEENTEEKGEKLSLSEEVNKSN